MQLLPDEAVANLRSILTPPRFEHSVRVMETSFQLFDAWDLPDEKRENMAWASLFHDCAKENPDRKMKEWLEKGTAMYGMELLDTPGLVHATVGTIILQLEYGIQDQEVLSAVAYHSTGHPIQTPVGWIVYIADILEPGRTFIEGREEFLQLALETPLEGLRQVTDLRHQISTGKGREVHPVSLRFKEYIDSVASWDELINANSVV